jgi:beta-glucosidase
MEAQKNLLRPEIEARINALLDKMTLEEKSGQLCQIPPLMAGGFDASAFDPSSDRAKDISWDYREDWIRGGLVGSYLGVQGAETINRLQKIAVEESRLGIPLIFGMDVIHGYRTVFPIPLAEACCWEPELAEKSAEVAAREAAAAGIHWTFAPMVDIARDARWGRIAEGSGEDPYLGSLLAAARVRGFQGADLADAERVIACAKHYIAYGGALAGRDYNTVEMAVQTLYETYLPPFDAAVKAGVATVMSAFNDLNGVPTSANHFTLTDILRGRLGFEGFVVSDYTSIGELVNHGYAADRKDAGRKAILAGVDMDMVTEAYRYDLPELVKEGAVPLAVLDEAVRRVLRIKFVMGLFDQPYRTTPERETEMQLRSESVALAREAARRSCVLLKNVSGTLPLRKNLKKIAVVGPLADDTFNMLGSWSFTGSAKDVVTPLAGIRAAAVGAKVLYARGCGVQGNEPADFAAALKAAKAADVVIACLGETSDMSGEAASRQTLDLPGQQLALLKALRATGKPLVVVVINGRPLALPEVCENADAVLEAWQLGVQAGTAIADVLFGDYNPAGRLVTSFPYTVGQEPLYYNRTSTGRPATDFKFTSRYIDGPWQPLFPFGYGLSYTSFEYRNLRLSRQEARAGETLAVTFELANTGQAAGEEVAQLYICDPVASRVRPVRELKGFRKVLLPVGETRTISIELRVDDLGFFNEAMQYQVEPGLFKVFVGPNAQEGLESSFQVL